MKKILIYGDSNTWGDNFFLGKRIDVGSFDSEEEARQGFIDYKQDYIRNVAKKCEGKVPNKTYEAMLNWKVEIGD